MLTVSAAGVPAASLDGIEPSFGPSMETSTLLLAAVPPVATPMPAAPTGAPAKLGVFQSVAISAARLPAAGKWQDARKTDYSAMFGDNCVGAGFSGCDSRFATKIRGLSGKVAGLSDKAMLDLVNRTVNGAMTYRSDADVWGVGDYWATPVEMARKGAGDCEDFAIAKYWALRSLGVPEEKLQLVLLQDTRRQLFHAVLIAHTGSGAYVLDNVSNRLMADTAYAQYQPIMSFTGETRAVADMPKDLSAVAPGMGL
jgi:predicted transglutaminase-like cysteine proteinase